jgi:hypothetical protein
MKQHVCLYVRRTKDDVRGSDREWQCKRLRFAQAACRQYQVDPNEGEHCEVGGTESRADFKRKLRDSAAIYTHATQL